MYKKSKKQEKNVRKFNANEISMRDLETGINSNNNAEENADNAKRNNDRGAKEEDCEVEK